MEDKHEKEIFTGIDIEKVMTELEALNRYDQTYIPGEYLNGVLNSLTANERSNIKTFMDDLNEKNLKFKISEQEIDEIKDSVNEVVDQFLCALGETNSAFEISHKYPVGSMAEGTSNTEPDEFDFIAILKHWSEPGAVTVERVMHITEVMSDPEMESERHHASVKFGNETDPEKAEFIIEHTKENNYWGYREYEKTVLNSAFKKCEAIEVVKTTGKLSVTNDKPEFHGPVNSFKMEWKPKTGKQGMTISIDIAIAIEVKGVANIIQEQDVFNATYFKALSDNDTYMLIPFRKCMEPDHTCFQLTFTNTEVQLVKSLSDNHKLCNKTLKYICGDHSKDRLVLSAIMSSYIIKTCVLMHATSCKNDIDPYSCMVDIICKVLFNIIRRQYGGKITVKCIFMQSMIVYDHFKDREECTTLRHFLLCVLDQIMKIGSANIYSFDISLEQFDSAILLERKKFNTIIPDIEDIMFHPARISKKK